MTGFSYERVFRIDFEDFEELEGLSVRAKFGTLDDYMRSRDLIAAWQAADDKVSRVDGWEALYHEFEIFLVEWNLTDSKTGESVPTTFEGMKSQDSWMILQIIAQWQKAIAGSLSGPKERTPSAGTRSVEGDIPMEPLSPNPSS